MAHSSFIGRSDTFALLWPGLGILISSKKTVVTVIEVSLWQVIYSIAHEGEWYDHSGWGCEQEGRTESTRGPSVVCRGGIINLSDCNQWSLGLYVLFRIIRATASSATRQGGRALSPHHSSFTWRGSLRCPIPTHHLWRWTELNWIPA